MFKLNNNSIIQFIFDNKLKLSSEYQRLMTNLKKNT